MCDKTVNDHPDLQEHYSTVHDTCIVACQYCDNIFDTIDSQKEHMIEKHEEVVVFYTVAKQVDNIEETVDKF